MMPKAQGQFYLFNLPVGMRSLVHVCIQRVHSCFMLSSVCIYVTRLFPMADLIENARRHEICSELLIRTVASADKEICKYCGVAF
jgi:hypothetical protein